MRKLTHPELLARQQEHLQQPRLPLCIILNDIRSAHNVGSIFRTCDGLGVEKIYLCGITAYPPNPLITKTALGSHKQVPWEHCLDVCPVVEDLKSKGYQIVVLEQTDKSVSYQEFNPSKPLCLVVGNEIEGVDQNVVDLCDDAIEIEMIGVKNSLNVSVALGIVAYDLKYKLMS